MEVPSLPTRNGKWRKSKLSAWRNGVPSLPTRNGKGDPGEFYRLPLNVPSLPTRNGKHHKEVQDVAGREFPAYLQGMESKFQVSPHRADGLVPSLPTRNGKYTFLRYSSAYRRSSQPTYKEWKAVIQLTWPDEK